MTFPGKFETHWIDRDGIKIKLLTAGEGPPLLLLHGYPQTSFMWRKMAPKLAYHFKLVIPDMRGYGDSDKPFSDPQHKTYSKREMAADMVYIMRKLGFSKFAIAGHDRGARVAHRLALDSERFVSHLFVMDIVPTITMYEKTDMKFASAYYHWFFLTQPFPLPETLIGKNPEFFLKHKLNQWGRTPGAINKEAFLEYLRCFSKADTIHASCEDYRASASIDLEHDSQDRNKRLKVPLLALWGGQGFVGENYDVVSEWKKFALNVKGQEIPGGHFLAEESPKETFLAMLNFYQLSEK